ncbi:MAG: hemerythrin domain-containing protein [Burkholderiales bacterium]|nr:hemerythrin domain-containing protein [Burkholderiales bacterium]
MNPSLSGSSRSDPFSILEQDHQEIDDLFDQYTQADDDSDDGEDILAMKAALVQELCLKLSLHARIEEEVVYPELRAAIDQPELIDESEIEHATASDLMAQLEAMEADDPDMDLTVEALAQCIRAHVATEETDVFPMAREAGIDVDRIVNAIDALRVEIERDAAAFGARAQRL